MTSGAAAAIAAIDRASFETVISDAKPMSQDSYSAGFDFEVNRAAGATIHYVHNNLNRTIEDLGADRRSRGLSPRQPR